MEGDNNSMLMTWRAHCVVKGNSDSTPIMWRAMMRHTDYVGGQAMRCCLGSCDKVNARWKRGQQ